MTTYKRILALILSFMMIVSITVTVGASETGTVTVTTGSGNPGDVVTVDINLESNPGIINMLFTVTYDESQLTLVGVEDTGLFPGWTPSANAYASGYTLEWSNFTASSNYTVTGTIAQLSFRINEDAVTAEEVIDIEYANKDAVMNFDGDTITLDITDGLVQVTGKEIEETEPVEKTGAVKVSATNGEVSETVEVDVVLESNPGIINMLFTVAYDESQLTLIDVEDTGLFPGWTPSTNAYASGYTLEWSNFTATSNYTDTGAIVTLTFKINEDAAAHGENVIDVEYANKDAVMDFDGETITLTITDGTVTVGHNYSATVTESTCDIGGYTTYTCACGESYIDDETEALGHDLEEVDRVDASCKGDGYIKYECTRCDYEKTETLSSAEYGHTQGDELARTEPTCTEKGSVTYKCSVCGEEITKEIAALGHNLKTETTAATCKEEGSIVTTCTRCDYTKTETLAKTSHTFGDWEVVEEATEDEEGLEERTCSVCGEKETREIEKVDDNKWSYLVQTIRRHALSQQKKAKEEAKEEVVEVVVEPDVIDEAIVEEPWENPFIDIFETDSYYAAIEFVYENGLFKGVSATEFAPDTTMTRAMFVTVLGRLHGITEDYVGESVFEDVVAGEWYAPYVVWAADNGIVLGYGDGTFGINDEITVEQAAVILARYAAFIELDVAAEYDLAAEYADAGDVAEWAVDGMTWVVAEGIYNGVEGNLNPQVPAARALVATMLYNFVK